MKSSWLKITSTPCQCKEEFRLRACRSEIRSVGFTCCLLQSQHPIQSAQPLTHFLPSLVKLYSFFPKVAPGKEDWIGLDFSFLLLSVLPFGASSIAALAQTSTTTSKTLRLREPSQPPENSPRRQKDLSLLFSPSGTHLTSMRVGVTHSPPRATTVVACIAMTIELMNTAGRSGPCSPSILLVFSPWPQRRSGTVVRTAHKPQKPFGNLLHFWHVVRYLELCVATATLDMETVFSLTEGAEIL